MAAYTYIMSCASNSAIHVGATGDLAARALAHRLAEACDHAARYRIRKLVYFEMFDTLTQADARRAVLVRWPRAWKNDLIGLGNPGWTDLAREGFLR